MHPRPEDYRYDLERALNSVVGLRATIPADAFTAETLGTERAGHGVLIRPEGLILTVGYLVTEAESVWISFGEQRTVPGHVLAYDQETGFGLVQALARLQAQALPIGDSDSATVGADLVVAGAGGRARAITAKVAARQEFAGYWEYVIDDAIFTIPAHPNWGGTAAIDENGELVGIGSLQLQQAAQRGQSHHLNMIIPINLLKPILDDLVTYGRPNRPPRPWLGLYATEVDDRVVIAGVASRGPAERADLQVGDIVLAVAEQRVSDLASLFRAIWSLGTAGVEVPLRIHRDGRTLDVRVLSSDRSRFLKKPRLH